MSNRTLIEINHDQSGMIEKYPLPFIEVMISFLRSNSPRNAAALEQYGIKVFGTRHHSDFYEIHWGGHYATEGKRTR